MTPETKIIKVMDSCLRALENIHQGNKRLAVGDLDHCKDALTASIYLLLAEIELEDED